MGGMRCTHIPAGTGGNRSHAGRTTTRIVVDGPRQGCDQQHLKIPGDLARFRVPLQQIALAAGDALALLAEDPDEVAVLTVLARQRVALTTRRGLLDSALSRQETEFRTACIHAAEHLADTVESIEASPTPDWLQLDAASETLNEELRTAEQKFNQGVGSLMSSQFADFTSEVREIEASPYARQILAMDAPADIERQSISVDPGLPGKPAAKRPHGPSWRPKAAEQLKEFQKAWGAGDGVRNAVDSMGHKFVYKAGKILRWKFKPYQAARWANNIGKAAKFGGAVLPVALEIYAILSDERQEVRAAKERLRRRNALVGNVLAQCDEYSATALTELRAELDSEFGKALFEIDHTSESVRGTQAQHSALERAISVIQSEAQSMLDRLGVPPLEA